MGTGWAAGRGELTKVFAVNGGAGSIVGCTTDRRCFPKRWNGSESLRPDATAIAGTA